MKPSSLLQRLSDQSGYPIQEVTSLPVAYTTAAAYFRKELPSTDAEMVGKRLSILNWMYVTMTQAERDLVEDPSVLDHGLYFESFSSRWRLQVKPAPMAVLSRHDRQTGLVVFDVVERSIWVPAGGPPLGKYLEMVCLVVPIGPIRTDLPAHGGINTEILEKRICTRPAKKVLPAEAVGREPDYNKDLSSFAKSIYGSEAAEKAHRRAALLHPYYYSKLGRG